MRRTIVNALAPFTCDACKRSMPARTERVHIMPSWRFEEEVMCRACWHYIMLCAGASILQQAQSPQSPK